ncbi:MAG: DNA polymerase III subunit delta [Prolixibacteraceae bacterium]|nr:DNA polymerase III subunit delta [Prolixibacteraceae bacterium]MBN2775492.1 DNA polymerase III subunit delta [Prolixibacteraceae bacterium]
MDYTKILEDLENKIYHPIYFLSGEEPYYIDLISDYIEDNVLTDAEKGFNQLVYYGKDTEVNTIIEASRRFPMMANQQVIIVKEAQSLKNIEDLKIYVEKPLRSTILVINYKYKKLDKRIGFVKTIQKNGIFFDSPRIYENKIPDWIEQYLADFKYTITPQAAIMLSEYLGANLSKVANELKKLIIALPEKTKITPEHIERNIGISKEYNVFELQNALGEKNVLKANRIINYFGANPSANPIQRTTASLHMYFSKLFIYHFLKDKSENSVAASLGLHPFFAKSYITAAKRYTPHKLFDIVGILREYDMKSKGYGNSSASEGELQKEMIYKILH